MSSRPKKTLSRGARAFAIAVACPGAVVIAASLHRLLSGAVPPQWLVFALLTLVSGAFTVKIPGITSRLSVSEIFAFTSVLLFGPATSTPILAAEGLLVSLRWKMSPLQTIFNIGNLALSIWAAGHSFFILAGVQPLYFQQAPYARLIVPLFVMTATYFGVNSGLTACAVATESDKGIGGVWREHFMPLAPSYFAGASVALLLVVAFQQVQFSAIALILPVLFISYLTQRSTLGTPRGLAGTRLGSQSAPALDRRDAGDGDRREGRSHARPRPPRAAGRAGARGRAGRYATR